MKLARILHNKVVYLARVEQSSCILLQQESNHPQADVLQEAIADQCDFQADGEKVDLQCVDVLAPVFHPSKVLALGLNYAEHVNEAKMDLPKSPILFSKMPSSIVGPNDPVCWKEADSNRVDYEAELAVIIGKEAFNLAEEDDPLRYIVGYTCSNDVSARDAQFKDKQWVRAKSFDTFCPLGPWIITPDDVPDPQNLSIRCEVAGEVLQDSSTHYMIFSIAEQIRYIANFMTLVPGDVILTGTPDGVGFARRPPIYLKEGDLMTVSIEGIGELSNRCNVE